MSANDDVGDIASDWTATTLEEAAKAQINSAIWLWFHEGDRRVPANSISVHTLAVAAQGILSQVARERPIELSPFVRAVESNPGAIDMIRSPQNFFKHGVCKVKKGNRGPHNPSLTAMILADNVGNFHRLFGTTTAFFYIYLFRYSLVVPDSKILLKDTEVKLSKRVKIEEIRKLPRLEFYRAVMPLIVEVMLDVRNRGGGS